MGMLPAYMSVPGALRPEKEGWIPGSRVTDGGEQPCGCYEPNLGPLQEQPVL